MIRFVCLILFVWQASATAETVYGNGDFKGETVKLEDLLKQSKTHLQKPLITEGIVTEVCKRAGCWANLREGSTSMRVIMGHHAFLIPKKLKGQRVIVQGKLEEVDGSEAEDMKVDSGKKVLQFNAVALKAP